jgi:hypothetical protein
MIVDNLEPSVIGETLSKFRQVLDKFGKKKNTHFLKLRLKVPLRMY